MIFCYIDCLLNYHWFLLWNYEIAMNTRKMLCKANTHVCVCVCLFATDSIDIVLIDFGTFGFWMFFFCLELDLLNTYSMSILASNIKEGRSCVAGLELSLYLYWWVWYIAKRHYSIFCFWWNWKWQKHQCVPYLPSIPSA